MTKRTPLFTSLVCMAVALSVRAEDGLLLRERRTGVMGTELHIEVLGSDGARLERAIDAAVGEIKRVEDLMTEWRSSPLTKLNEAAGLGPQSVPLELAQIIARGVELHRLTDGAFDLTWYSVGRLWNFKKDPPVIPDAVAIAAALPSVDASKVIVDSAQITVELPVRTRVGLGGIAKGYGIDRAMQMLRVHGIEHAMVSAGGDMKLLGKKFGKPWEVAIKHPRDRDRAMAVLKLSNACVVTSGDYERFFEHEGKRYHHILDPRSGYPSTGCLSATVVGQNAEYADALATAMCVLGSSDGMALVESLPRVEAILVDLDGAVHVSTGLKDVVSGQ